MKVLLPQSCRTLCDPMDCSPPDSSVHGILQVRILEWVVIPFSGGFSFPRDQTWVSCIAGRFFTVLTDRKPTVRKKVIELTFLCWHQFSSVAQSYLTLGDPVNRSTPGLPVHRQLPESTQPMSIESVMPSNHLILCRSLLLLPSIFPSIRIFSMSQLFASDGQSIGVSASAWILPMNT